MNLLTKSLISELVGDNIVTALYGGGFKPPTKGHFEVVQKALTEFPEIDKFIVYVGSGERNGITQAESLLIWEIYKKYLGDKVEIQPSKAPIGDIIRYGKSHPEEVVYFVIGARDGNEGDLQDVALRTSGVEDKYPNVKIKVIQTPDAGISGTKAREASKKSPEAFYKFLPPVINDNERLEIFGYIQDVVTEIVTDTEVICDNCGWEWSIADGGDDLYICHKCGHDNNPDLDEASDPEAGTALPYGSGFAPIKENASYSKDIDVKEKILELTKHMLAKGMNIKPLPKVKFVNGDSNNAREFLGKTAYYDPNNFTITLYTEGRHPKDIVRSFSHEMIHHIQNLENRLGDVSTTNTMEDDNIDKLEQEANLKGTMTFRNWTDSLNEVKEEVTDSMVVVLSRKGNQINLYNLRTNEALGNINTYGNEVTGVAAKKGYGPLMYELGMANIYPKGLQSDRHGNTEPAAEAVWKKYIAGASPNIKVEKLTPKDRDYRTTYAGDGYDSSFIPDFYNYKFYNPNTAILKQLIERGNALSDELKKQILLDSAKLYNDMVNEANLKGTMTFRNWTDSLNESLEEATQYIWKHREDILSLPMMENKKKVINELNEQSPQIYCDMDGVLVDFDKQFEKASGGIPPREYEDKNGKEAFWNVINEKGVGFWVGMPWMVNGKQLWDHIKPYNPKLLSAPSRSNESRLGKRLWVKNNIPGTELILAYAENKKNYADGNNILIDDRPSNIDQWKAAGGIGILFISTEQTIKELSKYGL